MEVIKRDGTKESYNCSKIEKAVEKAMFATYKYMEPVMLSEPFTVSLYVWDVIKDVKEPVSIKQLENIIFRKLTDDGYSDAAVNYIEYKTKRDMARSKHKLTQDFLDKYPDYPDCMDELAKFVYIRTYSRWLPDKNRRETWKETCARAINGNCSYLPTEDGEPEKLFDNMFNLRQRISGRMLWMGGTEALDKTPLAAYNCSGIVMDSINAFHELFYLLMVGTGVGCRVLKEDVAKLPQFDTAKKLYHVKTPGPQGTTLERTKVSNYGNSVIITVGDSKEGWCEALTAYLNTMADDTTKSISIDYSYIRPQGAPLKTFGGYASGYTSLKEMFEKLNKIITEESTNGKLRPLNVADMCNIVGQNVVAGGTRRTAELILFSPDDEEMLHAKENLDPEHYFRYMSNNSMYLEDKPSKEELRKLMISIKETAEPGFVNVKAAKERRADFDIVNPCCEIMLPNKAVCNLTNINVSKFIDERGNVMVAQLKEACKLSARACYRLTEPELELEGWSEIHHRDRLIGCSITGWQDAVADNITKLEQGVLLTLMKTWIKDAANEYADENNRPRPVLYTTVQPDGTGGLISGCSAGIHYNHSPYYFRRVRISTNSPLYQAIKYLDGWQIDNEVGQDDNGNTKVITFPCKSNSRITKYNVSAIEQLEQYKIMQTHYVDHNTSITVTVRDDEWDDVTDWLDKNWDCVVGISFLSLNQDYYPLMPYEECTEKQYLELKSKMAPFDQELVNKYEFELQTVGKDFEIDESGECEDGHCPVR